MTAAIRYVSSQTVTNFSDALATALRDPNISCKSEFAEGLSKSFDHFAQNVDPETPRVAHARVMTIFQKGITQGNEEGLHQIVQKLNRIVSLSFLEANTPLNEDVGGIVLDYV